MSNFHKLQQARVELIHSLVRWSKQVDVFISLHRKMSATLDRIVGLTPVSSWCIIALHHCTFLHWCYSGKYHCSSVRVWHFHAAHYLLMMKHSGSESLTFW